MTGGCQCGAVRYRISAPPIALYVCHCLECRRQSASAFGMSLIVPRKGYALTAGDPRHWSRRTDSGRQLDCWFCADCGTRLYHAWPEDDATVSVKAGTLDQPVDMGRAIHIWTDRHLPGLDMNGLAEGFPGEPD